MTDHDLCFANLRDAVERAERLRLIPHGLVEPAEPDLEVAERARIAWAAMRSMRAADYQALAVVTRDDGSHPMVPARDADTIAYVLARTVDAGGAANVVTVEGDDLVVWELRRTGTHPIPPQTT